MKNSSASNAVLKIDHKTARFNGPDYDQARDNIRLGGQLSRIFALMRDGKPRSLAEISNSTGDPAASVSAQLRHLRKRRFGAHTVTKQHHGRGLYKYALVVNPHTTETIEFTLEA